MAAKRSASYLAIVKSRLNMAVLKDRGQKRGAFYPIGFWKAYERTSCRRQVVFMTSKSKDRSLRQLLQGDAIQCRSCRRLRSFQRRQRTSVKHEQRVMTELQFERVGRHRAAEQITLNFVTAVLPQEIKLLVGFDALGDHREVEAVGHGDDCPGDLCILFTGWQAVDESAVDFQYVDRELLEVIER